MKSNLERELGELQRKIAEETAKLDEAKVTLEKKRAEAKTFLRAEDAKKAEARATEMQYTEAMTIGNRLERDIDASMRHLTQFKRELELTTRDLERATKAKLKQK